MSKFNLRFFVGLVLVALVLTGVVFGVHYFQSGRIARALLWQAGRAEEQGHPDQAARFLSRYLEFAPEDTEERAHLGRVLASAPLADSLTARQRALFVLEQVVSREPERHDSRRLLVRLALELQQFQLAEPHLRVLRDSFPADGEVEQLQAQWHDAQGQYAEAVAWYRKAVTNAPHEVDSYVRLAELLRSRLEPARKTENAREADQVMNTLVGRNEAAYQAHLGRWQYLRERWDSLTETERTAAARDVTRAIELAPKELDVLLAAADLAQANGKLDEARTHLQEGSRSKPEDGRFYRKLAAVELEAGRRSEAVACLRGGARLPRVQGRYELLWDLANLLIDGKELDEAAAVIAQVRQVNSAQASVDYLQARVRMVEGHWADAAGLLERARPHLEAMPDLAKQVDLFLSQCYEQLDEPKLQLAAYQRVLARDPSYLPVQLRLGAAQGSQGQLDEALSLYRQAMNSKEAPPSGWLDIARLLIVRNLRSDSAQRDWREVETALRRAAEAQPDSVAVPILHAEALVAQNQLDQARERLIQARDRQPKQAEVWAALAALAERQGKLDEAGRILDEAKQKAGDSVALRLAQARYWAQRHDASARTALAELGRVSGSFSPEDQLRLHRGLAVASYQIGDIHAALEQWSAVSQEPGHANDLRVRALMFDLALQAGDEPAMKRLLDEFQRIEGRQGTFWCFSEARRLTWQARQGKPQLLDQARDLLDTVAARRPTWSAVLLARAEIAQLKGNPEQAIAHYREALELGERSPLVVRKLVQLLVQRQRFAEAEQESLRLQKQGLMTADMQRLAVDISLLNQDPDRALKLAQEAVTADSKDYRDYLWLAQVLAAGGRPAAEVEEKLRRAVALADEVPETWVALVQHLAQAGRKQDAEAALKDARAKLKADQLPLALAACYESLGQNDQAQQQFAAALAARPEQVATLQAVAGYQLRRGRLAEAEPLLRKVAERRVPASEAEIAWARRNLALALAGGGDRRRFPEALSLVGLDLDASGGVLEKTRPTGEDATEELRVRTQVLAALNTVPLRARAIAILEELNARHALTAADQFRLAQLYEAGQAWPKARELLRSLAAAQSQNPIVLAQFARALLRHRQIEDAEGYVERLAQLETERKVESGTFGAVELQAQVLEGRGQGDKAVALLKSYVEKKAAPPERALALIACLARQQRLPEALDWCERAWQTCAPEAAGTASVTVLRMNRPSREQMERVEHWLRAALDKDPKSTALLLHLAGVLDLRGQLEEAEKIYAQALEHEPGNVIAMNNLAWLLAHRSGKGTDALPLINRALEAAGPRADLLDTRAIVYLALGRSDQAIQDLRVAIADQPTAARYFHLARAQRMAERLDEAAASFRQAKAAGLQAQLLHPAERIAFLKLADELEQR